MHIIKGAKTGKDNGYTMLFDIESFDYSYYDEGSEGLKLALVHHLDMPIMRQKGFHIAPGFDPFIIPSECHVILILYYATNLSDLFIGLIGRVHRTSHTIWSLNAIT